MHGRLIGELEMRREDIVDVSFTKGNGKKNLGSRRKIVQREKGGKQIEES